jgi:hypothetical protein
MSGGGPFEVRFGWNGAPQARASRAGTGDGGARRRRVWNAGAGLPRTRGDRDLRGRLRGAHASLRPGRVRIVLQRRPHGVCSCVRVSRPGSSQLRSMRGRLRSEPELRRRPLRVSRRRVPLRRGVRRPGERSGKLRDVRGGMRRSDALLQRRHLRRLLHRRAEGVRPLLSRSRVERTELRSLRQRLRHRNGVRGRRLRVPVESDHVQRDVRRRLELADRLRRLRGAMRRQSGVLSGSVRGRVRCRHEVRAQLRRHRSEPWQLRRVWQGLPVRHIVHRRHVRLLRRCRQLQRRVRHPRERPGALRDLHDLLHGRSRLQQRVVRRDVHRSGDTLWRRLHRSRLRQAQLRVVRRHVSHVRLVRRGRVLLQREPHCVQRWVCGYANRRGQLRRLRLDVLASEDVQGVALPMRRVCLTEAGEGVGRSLTHSLAVHV